MGIKIWECAICKRLYTNNVKNVKRFIGNKKDVRVHSRKEHNIKGRRNTWGVPKKDFGQSDITKNCILYKEY